MNGIATQTLGAAQARAPADVTPILLSLWYTSESQLSRMSHDAGLSPGFTVWLR
jgi:hypothetical protein